MTYFINKPFDDIRIGDSATLQRVLTKKDIDIFAIVSGDVNPAHIDADYAKNSIFHAVVAHGMWAGALISTVLGTKLPGPGTIYLSQTLKFHKPVYVGDKITVTLRVAKKYVRKPVLLLTCICTNQHQKIVVTGVAKVLASKEKITCRRVSLPTIVLKNST